MTSFDRRQYVLLLTLLRTLGSRRELTSQFGMHGPALGILAGLGLLMGAFIALLVFSGQVPARDVLDRTGDGARRHGRTRPGTGD